MDLSMRKFRDAAFVKEDRVGTVNLQLRGKLERKAAQGKLHYVDSAGNRERWEDQCQVVRRP